MEIIKDWLSILAIIILMIPIAAVGFILLILYTCAVLIDILLNYIANKNKKRFTN